MNRRLVAADAAPRCVAHSSRSGKPCKNPATTGMRVCHTHGGQAPQVREAARLRAALALDPCVRRLVRIAMTGADAQALVAIEKILKCNDFTAFGVERQAPAGFGSNLTVQTQVNLPEVRVASMSDQELETYDKLLTELRELLPAEEPKTLPGTRVR